MRQVIRLLMFAFVLLYNATATQAQDSMLKRMNQMRTIIEVEDEDEELQYEVFAMDKDSSSQYYLSVGNLGFGNKNIQILADPLFCLYIKLGNTLAESSERLEQLLAQMQEEPGTSAETTGYLSLGVPDETKTETVTITTRKSPLAGRYLQFSVQREGYIRAATVQKSQLKGLIFNMKLYRKTHKKEK